MLKKIFQILAFCVAILSLLTSCRRYTPAYLPAANPQTIGEEQFYKADKENLTKLKKLVHNRVTNTFDKTTEIYRIGTEDLIDITVFDVEEMNSIVRVRPSGNINMPTIGEISAAGKTEAELEEQIEKQLKRFIRKPNVRVFIKEYGAHKVSVMGQVHKPGSYPLRRENYSLLEVLSEAGGRKDTAGGRLILIPQDFLTSNSPDSTKDLLAELPRQDGIEIYFDDLLGGGGALPINVPLRSGDTVIVPEAGKYHVDGEVKRPGSFPLTSRTTLLGAIAAAGGLHYAADVESVEIIRAAGTKDRSLLSLDLEQIALDRSKDIRLRDGDVIRVPSAGFRFATSQVVEVINRIVNVGVSSSVQ